ncbi:hypothetical protein KFL_000740210 [Klebsormidium nitens]|uniref:Nudix hydrolase domain-containing protein n=1 Tax=Klebsormidium nitens TaxID=105231 RepID=A0A1Y1HW62_KLENI|nr:hypothetical protein KFL_000740210 [Klebsormidium nitens]|eukprot:GAQ81221.1 hypothetical protein KFL_000740210 [Klebsormidium nitens]
MLLDLLDQHKQRVAECNVGRESIRGPEFLELRGNGLLFGYVHESFAEHLLLLDDTFKVYFVRSKDGSPLGHYIGLDQSLKTPKARTKAVAAVCSELREKGVITGWRDELYPVSTGFHNKPYFGLERAAAPHFGIIAYGVHMNGYTEDADGNKYLWVARRSATKQTWPLRLDHLVAGGQPLGLSCADNLVKECQEEAGIPPDLARRATAAGTVSYEMVTDENRAKRDVLFVYDLKLPSDFQPKNQDGEVESFELWPLARVAETIRKSNEYKPNVALVIIDFLVRHGYIHPDQKGYVELVSSLRTGCVEAASRRTT